MQRKFLINIFILILVNLLVKPFWIFGIDRTVQNITGPEAYGLYFAIFNFSIIFYAIADLGLNHHYGQRVATDPSIFSNTFWKMFIIKTVMGLIYLIVCLAVALSLNYPPHAIGLLRFLALNQIFISILIFCRNSFTSLHRFKIDAFFSVFDKIIAITICAMLIWGNYTQQSFQIAWFVYAQTAAFGIAAFTALFVLLILYKPNFNWPSIGFVRTNVSAALPFALLFVLMSLYQKTDSVMIERMLPNGDEQAGIYAAAYRLLDALSMVGFLVAGLLIPMYSRMIASKQSVLQLFRTSAILLFTFSIMLSIAAVIYRTEIIALLYHTTDPYWGKVFIQIILALNGTCMMYAFGSLLTANRSLHQLNLLALIGFTLNIGLNLWLIPHYQALGAAFATLVTQVFISLGQLMICFKIFNFKVDKILTIQLFALCIFSIVIMSATKLIAGRWFVDMSIGLSLIIVFAYAIRLFKLADIFELSSLNNKS